MQSQLKSYVSHQASESRRVDTINQFETAFAKTMMNEGIKATVGFARMVIGVTVESQEAQDKALELLKSVTGMRYTHTDFYPAEEDMPAEWYLRFNY